MNAVKFKFIIVLSVIILSFSTFFTYFSPVLGYDTNPIFLQDIGASKSYVISEWILNNQSQSISGLSFIVKVNDRNISGIFGTISYSVSRINQCDLSDCSSPFYLVSLGISPILNIHFISKTVDNRFYWLDHQQSSENSFFSSSLKLEDDNIILTNVQNPAGGKQTIIQTINYHTGWLDKYENYWTDSSGIVQKLIIESTGSNTLILVGITTVIVGVISLGLYSYRKQKKR
ncbi:MAG: hypothetical protein ACFFD1_09720 [Candidatus Thorarchaeota archaeon]